MNLKEQQKISGSEAIKALLEGKYVYDAHGARYVIEKETGTLWYESPFYRQELDRTFNQVITNDWYIPKPFDVRQAMLDRPNEWVGAFKGSHGGWFALGFDSNDFHPVFVAIREMDEVGTDSGRVLVAIREQIDNAISIQDVPKEATR